MENRQGELACQGETTIEPNTPFDVEWDCLEDGGYDVACHNFEVNDVHWSRVNDMECSIDPSYQIGDVGQEVFIQNLIRTGMMSNIKDAYQKPSASEEDIDYLSSASTEYFSCYSDDSEEECNTKIKLPNSGTEQHSVQITFGEVIVNIGVTVSPRHTFDKTHCSENGHGCTPPESSSEMIETFSKLSSITDPEQIHCTVEKNYRLMDSPTSNNQHTAYAFSQDDYGEINKFSIDCDSTVKSETLAYNFHMDWEGQIFDESTSSIRQSECKGPRTEYPHDSEISCVANHCKQCGKAERCQCDKGRSKANDNTQKIYQNKEKTKFEDNEVIERYNVVAAQLTDNVIKSSVNELLLQYWRSHNNHRKGTPADSADLASSLQPDKTFHSSKEEKNTKAFTERMSTPSRGHHSTPYTEPEKTINLMPYTFDYDVDLAPNYMSCKSKEKWSKPESQFNKTKGIRCLWNPSRQNKSLINGDKTLCFDNLTCKTVKTSNKQTERMVTSNLPTIAGKTQEKESTCNDMSVEGQQLQPGTIMEKAKYTSRGKECTGKDLTLSSKRATAREQFAWKKETPTNKNMNTGFNVSVHTESCCANRFDYNSASATLSRQVTVAAINELTLEIWRMWNMNISEERRKVEARKMIGIVILKAKEELIHERCDHSKQFVIDLSYTKTTCCNTKKEINNVYSMQNEIHGRKTGKPIPFPTKNNKIKEKSSAFGPSHQSDKLVASFSNGISTTSDTKETSDQGKQNESKDKKTGKSQLPVPVHKKGNLMKERPKKSSSHVSNILVLGSWCDKPKRGDNKAIPGQVHYKKEIQSKGLGKSYLPVPVPKITSCVKDKLIHDEQSHKTSKSVSDKTTQNVTKRKAVEACSEQNEKLPRSHLPVPAPTENNNHGNHHTTKVYKKEAVNCLPSRNLSAEQIKIRNWSETSKKAFSGIPIYKKVEKLTQNSKQRNDIHRENGTEGPKHKRLSEITVSEMSFKKGQKYRKTSSYDVRESKVKPKKESGTNVFVQSLSKYSNMKSEGGPVRRKGEHVSPTKYPRKRYLNSKTYPLHKGEKSCDKQQICNNGRMKNDGICYTGRKLPIKQRGIFFELFRNIDVPNYELIEKYKEIEIEQISKLLSKYAVVGAKMELSLEYLRLEYTKQKAIRSELKEITYNPNTTRGSSLMKPNAVCLICYNSKRKKPINPIVPTKSKLKFERHNNHENPKIVNARSAASDKSSSYKSCKMCSRPDGNNELAISNMYHHMKSRRIYHSEKEQKEKEKNPGDFEFQRRNVKCALCKKRQSCIH